MPFEREFEVAIAAAREAGAAVLPFFRSGGMVVHDKGNPTAAPTVQGESTPLKQGAKILDPVSEADLLADRIIFARLSAAFPDDAILSEERAADASIFTKRRIWCVDPIDGTREFINGLDDFAVQIGLLINRVPAFGVCYAPSLDLLFGGAIGHGAWSERNVGDERVRTVLKVSGVDDPARATFLASRFHHSSLANRLVEAAGVGSLVTRGSIGHKVLSICEGEADGCLHPSHRTKWWDTAGPLAVLNAAGGLATDLWGDPLDYSGDGIIHARGLFFSNTRLHRVVLARVEAHLPERLGQGE